MIRNVARRLPRRPFRPTVVTPAVPVCGYIRMSSSLPPVIPPVSTSLPSDSFQLLSTADKVGDAENELFEKQVKEVEAWWKTPRYEGIRRPYSAADVVSKRGSLLQTYPSSIMARKLFNLLNERAAKGEPVHTSKRILFAELMTYPTIADYLLRKWVQLIQCR